METIRTFALQVRINCELDNGDEMAENFRANIALFINDPDNLSKFPEFHDLIRIVEIKNDSLP